MAETKINSKPLLENTMQSWVDRVTKCKYVMNGELFDGEIHEKVVIDGMARFNITVSNRLGLEGTDIITEIILVDDSENAMVTVTGEFLKEKYQGRFFQINISLKEK